MLLKRIILVLFTLCSKACVAGGTHASPRCPILFDGRIARDDFLDLFDTEASPFNSSYVKGANVSFSQILEFPRVPPSRFDGRNNKAVEVTIDDRSIFLSGGVNPQLGFRRAELILANQNGSDASNTGVVTFHWSVRADPKKPLNYSHEYQCVWHERNDFTANQFEFETGTLLEGTTINPKNWKLLNQTGDVVWQTPMDWSEWQNWALTFDYANNLFTTYYSNGLRPLRAVTDPLPNNLTGGGQFHAGVLKKPTKIANVSNEAFTGYQESGIHEGLIYGGIFIEDSAGGCVST